MSGVIPEITVTGSRSAGGGFSLGDSFRFSINNGQSSQSDGAGGSTSSVDNQSDAEFTFPNGLKVTIDVSSLPPQVADAFMYIAANLNLPEFADIKSVFDDLKARGYNEIIFDSSLVGPLDANGNLTGTWSSTTTPGHITAGITDYSVPGKVAITFNGNYPFDPEFGAKVVLHESMHAARPHLTESQVRTQTDDLWDDIVAYDPNTPWEGFGNSVSGEGSTGNNHLSGNTGHDHLDGLSGNDSLYGGAGDDWIEGGAGNDQLFGGADNDLFVPGAGNDVMYGGSGNDHYIFDTDLSGSLGDTSGTDLIEIEFTSSVNFARSGNALIIDGPGSGNDLTIFNWFNGQEIETVRLGNFVSLSSQDINQIIAMQSGGTSGFVAPIVFDLDGDGIELIDLDEREVKLDWDGDGKKDYSGWVSADDGLLMYDQNQNGKVDGVDEITFTQFLEGAKTDLEGLAGLDDNGDGKITAQDSVWNDLFVWQDTNLNGKSNPNELFSMEEMGITEILLQSDNELTKNAENIIFGHGSYITADGASHLLADAAFRTNTDAYTWQDQGELYHQVTEYYA